MVRILYARSGADAQGGRIIYNFAHEHRPAVRAAVANGIRTRVLPRRTLSDRFAVGKSSTRRAMARTQKCWNFRSVYFPVALHWERRVPTPRLGIPHAMGRTFGKVPGVPLFLYFAFMHLIWTAIFKFMLGASCFHPVSGSQILQCPVKGTKTGKH